MTAADVRAVAAILQNPEWESPEAAAKAVIEALDAARRDRMTYAVAVNGRPLPHIYIGFENREECKRWVKRVGLDVAALDVWVVPVWSKDAVLPRHQRMTEELEAKKQKELDAAPKGRTRAPRKRAA